MGKEKLLHTKLMPPRLPERALVRQALLNRLEDIPAKKVTLLKAPTGYGKSTLVRMWLTASKTPSAWVALDESDNDPVRFWTYTITALRSQNTSVGKASLAALKMPQPGSFQGILTALINDCANASIPFVLVLEDYHVVSSSDIHKSLTFLIQHLPESLHLVIISRNEPDLPLAILRARGELLELGADDLRFSREETGSFLSLQLGSDLPEETVSHLQERTEGWPAGLRLMALSLQNKDSRLALQHNPGSQRYVEDYLVQEVFASQSPSIQQFLLQTCFLNRLTGELTDAVTLAGDGERILAQLARENLFILQLDSMAGQAWYRYHPMFAESIVALARQRLGNGEIQAIYERACAWYERQQRLDEAIEIALDAKLIDRALPLIEKFIEIYDLSQMLTFARWLEAIPPQALFGNPRLSFAFAAVILYSSDRFAPATVARLEPFLSAAETAWRGQGYHRGIGEVLSFRGNAALWQGNFQKAFHFARQSLAELPEQDVLYRGTSLLILSFESLYAGKINEAQDRALEARALMGAAQNIYGALAATQVLCECLFWQGDLEQTERLSQQLLEEAVGDESMLDDQGTASLNLARIAYERNDLETADIWVSRSLELSQKRGNEFLETQATITQASIIAARGDADHACKRVKSLLAKVHNPALSREILAAQARFSMAAGDLLTVKGWRATVLNTGQDNLPVQNEREAFMLARLVITEDRPKDALELLGPWKADAVANGRLRSQVEALCLEARAYQAGTDTARASQALVDALRSGHSRGLRRLFLDEGPRMAALLQVVLPQISSRSLKLYASGLLQDIVPGSGVAGEIALVEPLSQQELRVLRLIAAGLSNSAIAGELVVSLNTVKTHVKNIYSKLDVSSRDEAREAAKELRLV